MWGVTLDVPQRLLRSLNYYYYSFFLLIVKWSDCRLSWCSLKMLAVSLVLLSLFSPRAQNLTVLPSSPHRLHPFWWSSQAICVWLRASCTHIHTPSISPTGLQKTSPDGAKTWRVLHRRVPVLHFLSVLQPPSFLPSFLRSSLVEKGPNGPWIPLEAVFTEVCWKYFQDMEIRELECLKAQTRGNEHWKNMFRLQTAGAKITVPTVRLLSCNHSITL